MMRNRGGSVDKKSVPTKKYMMPVGEFIKRLKDEKDPNHSDFLILLKGGKSEAARLIDNQDQNRAFNGYQPITFVSEEFVQKLTPHIDKLISFIDKDGDFINEEEMKEVIKIIYTLIIDYVCDEFLDEKGQIKTDIASTVLGVEDVRVLDVNKVILSARENITGNFIDLLINHVLAKAKLTKEEEQRAKEIDNAIQIYLKPQLPKNLYQFLIKNNGKLDLQKAPKEIKRFFSLASNPWNTKIIKAFAEAKEENEKKRVFDLAFSQYQNADSERKKAIIFLKSNKKTTFPLSIPTLKKLSKINTQEIRDHVAVDTSYEQRRNRVREYVDKDLFQKYDEYFELKRIVAGPANRALERFGNNFGSDPEHLNKFVQERIDIYRKKQQKGLLEGEKKEENLAPAVVPADVPSSSVSAVPEGAAERDRKESLSKHLLEEEKKNLAPAVVPAADVPSSSVSVAVERKSFPNPPVKSSTHPVPSAPESTSFIAGLTGWKKYAFWGGLALMAVAACVVTLGAALPAVAAVATPLIAAGTFAGYSGFLGMVSATLSNSFIAKKYQELTNWKYKMAAATLVAAIVIGVSIVTGGAALGLFAGIGFAAGITTIATAHASVGLVGAKAALGIASGVKSLSIPVVAAGAHKRLSSSAALRKTLGGHDGGSNVPTEEKSRDEPVASQVESAEPKPVTPQVVAEPPVPSQDVPPEGEIRYSTRTLGV